MKKIITILLCFLIALSVNAKDYKNELSFTYGQFTVPQFAYVMGGVLGVAFTAGHFTFENSKFIGAAGFEYIHYTNDWFGYGGTIVCDYMTSDAYNVSSEGEKTYNGKFNLGFISIMPNVKFSWFNRERVSLYSKIAVGPGLIFDNDDSLENNITLAAQISPIGVDFGNNSYRGFAELGIGMQGILNVGIRKLF